ncbi:hypothetical protein, partial [Rhodoferax sp.]|uniref:hypothetical protein n=1 Tax=Rhodoferax sp. TaxID=50421 RepID=UPI0025D890FC
NLSNHEALSAANHQHPKLNFGNLQKRSCFIQRLEARLRCQNKSPQSGLLSAGIYAISGCSPRRTGARSYQ